MSTVTDKPGVLLESSTKFWLDEQIREQLKSLRTERELTQSEVAEKLGKDQVFVSNCESGRRRLDPVELLAFSEAYDVPVKTLFENLDVEEARDREYGPVV